MAEPASLEFRAMGSPCRVVVESGAEELAERVRELVASLEAAWSRFRDDSEISAVNRAAGRVTVVSEPTYQLIGAAVRAVDATGGLFNPLMLHQIEALGYRWSWDEARPEPTDAVAVPAVVDPIELYPEIRAIRLPDGCGFDPGGIGKGLAVDLAIELCQSAGSSFASVELGGDLRVYGPPWYGDRWDIAVADPFERGGPVATFTPAATPAGGAVTTSTTLRRRWTHGERTLHHILDPRSGQPSGSDLVAATTCADLAWWAEVASKTALLTGSAGAVHYLRSLGVPGAVVTEAGQVLSTEGSPAREAA